MYWLCGSREKVVGDEIVNHRRVGIRHRDGLVACACEVGEECANIRCIKGTYPGGDIVCSCRVENRDERCACWGPLALWTVSSKTRTLAEEQNPSQPRDGREKQSGPRH